MNTRKTYIIIAALLFASASLFAQTSIKDMERKKQRMEQDINYTNSIINKTQEKQRTNIDHLNLVKKNVDTRKSLLKSIDTRMSTLSQEIDARQKKTTQLSGEMTQLKEQYAKMLRTAYRSRDSYSQLMYILASEDINQAYRRINYLKSSSDALVQHADKISAQNKLLTAEIAKLQQDRAEQETLQEQKTKEISNLSTEMKDYERIVNVLKHQEKTLLADLEDKKKQAVLLNRQIEVAIAEEARREAERQRREREQLERQERERLAAELKKRKGKATATPVQVKPAVLDSRFEKLKGHLQVPVNQGLIVTRFGINQYPGLEHVKINSNGIDIATNIGAAVNVVADGIVRKIFTTGSTTSILVQHDVYYTVYTHLAGIKVSTGDMVNARQVLGIVAPSNDRAILHFELWKQTEKQDPEAWLVKR
jgi:septal ring factor EnvC (AmiA/AmiB activator)